MNNSAPIKSSLLGKFVRSPFVTMAVGILLVLIGIFETTETAMEKLFHFHLNVGHGVLIVGVFNVLHSIVIFIEGLENISVASEEQNLEREIKEEEDVIHQKQDEPPGYNDIAANQREDKFQN